MDAARGSRRKKSQRHRIRLCFEFECHREPNVNYVVAHVNRSASACAVVNANACSYVDTLPVPGARGGTGSTGCRRILEGLNASSVGMYTPSQSHRSVLHDVFGALHLIRFFLRPSSRAPAVERIESARCVLQARGEALRGVARRRSFAARVAEACMPIGGVCASQSRGSEACLEIRGVPVSQPRVSDPCLEIGLCDFRNQEALIHA